ncbi:metalloregulator ArsR/SmtB family transcription factor [Sphaerisporangium sp. TRM90804]|uniref:ArsR/SmtB family transcription factor n=1 Tax=Sphaerisporangium sp. TRM90804 TaxID=3031113 RepID=UPI00244ACADB|nr:metalloregulator ArsR/SmtB family transcription factor [Sphaerisporangium sp. TRM90804]MDH2426369.1 metalloregulator ArsR/SmtB family transcription factor [Sphaerisporangium sp. TRM90804]
MSNIGLAVAADGTSSAQGCCAPLEALPLDPAHATDMAKMFKALGDPVRLRLLSIIAAHPDGEVCVCDLTTLFDVAAPTISYHLKLLRETGLVEHDRRGTWVYYRPVRERLRQLSALLAAPDMAEAAR